MARLSESYGATVTGFCVIILSTRIRYPSAFFDRVARGDWVPRPHYQPYYLSYCPFSVSQRLHFVGVDRILDKSLKDIGLCDHADDAVILIYHR